MINTNGEKYARLNDFVDTVWYIPDITSHFASLIWTSDFLGEYKYSTFCPSNIFANKQT